MTRVPVLSVSRSGALIKQATRTVRGPKENVLSPEIVSSGMTGRAATRVSNQGRLRR